MAGVSGSTQTTKMIAPMSQGPSSRTLRARGAASITESLVHRAQLVGASADCRSAIDNSHNESSEANTASRLVKQVRSSRA
jgi:hypothetical protein